MVNFIISTFPTFTRPIPPPTAHPEQEQDLQTELPEMVGELIEKFRRQEKLSLALQEVNLDGIALDSSV